MIFLMLEQDHRRKVVCNCPEVRHAQFSGEAPWRAPCRAIDVATGKLALPPFPCALLLNGAMLAAWGSAETPVAC